MQASYIINGGCGTATTSRLSNAVSQVGCRSALPAALQQRTARLIEVRMALSDMTLR